MTASATLTTELAYYARNGAALFPIPAGSKEPFGIVESFKHDWSRDPAQWDAWRSAHPRCNFGVVGFASNWIIVDTDTSGGEEGRAEAWKLRGELFASWGLDPATTPHVQSPSGSWHDYFQVPAHVDAAALRQPDAIKKRINIRCIGYTVAAGGYCDGSNPKDTAGPYLLFPNAAPPHPAPDALIAHCTRAAPAVRTLPGSRDKGDVAALLTWLDEHDAFASYEDWFGVGMALRLEFGDDGFDIWALTFNEKYRADPDRARPKWQSFATEPTAESVTLNSFLDRAHKLGWTGTVRRSSAAMFDGVAQLAAMAGASLSSGMPTGAGSPGIPMLAGQEELARLAAPILANFLTTTADTPPAVGDFPMLPAAMSGHGLYADMQTCLKRIAALAEGRLKPARITDVLAVLNLLHADVFDAVARQLRAAGHVLQDRKIKQRAMDLSEKVERITVTGDKWEYDKNGLPESDNSDNVATLLGVLSLDLRWNGWAERMEIQGGIDADLRWPVWTYVDDTVVAKLRTRANRTKTRFRPGKDFLWETLLSMAHANAVDPVLDTLAEFGAGWDGTPRLDGWLSRYCGTPDDVYHRAVGRLILGGMIKRARYPGCKFDFMPIFFGPQGTGKSTMAAILADLGATSLPEIARGKGQHFTDNVMLGDTSKELILALAGKLVAEIGEMGTRGNANVTHIKAMLSRQVDEGRTAYARAVTSRPRRNILIGTTNDENPLTDTTGNRRFLPISVTQEIDLVGLHADIRQIIGEAARLEAEGVSFDLPREVWAIAGEHQEAARAVGDVEARLCTWFAETAFTAAAFVSTDDLAELCDIAGWRGVHTFRNSILKRLGFREVQPYVMGVRTRGWQRGQGKADQVTRYGVGKTQDGRPRVTIRGGSAGVPSVPPLPY